MGNSADRVGTELAIRGTRRDHSSKHCRERGREMPDSSVVIIGNATADPELGFTQNGSATARFGVAVNRRWQNRQSQEWEEQTSFFDVVCWRDLAEHVCESLTARRTRDRHRDASSSAAGRPTRARCATMVEVVADEIGPSAAGGRPQQVTKNKRQSVARHEHGTTLT